MTILIVAAACGGSQKEHENPIVQGSDVSPTCCCKTVPDTAEKEIVPNFAPVGRMECSTEHGSCVDDVQCNGQAAPATPSSSSDTGVPPPPTLGGSGGN
jgi:hypothetical protein